MRSVNAAKCRECGTLSYPTHFSCPSCGAIAFEAIPVEGDGTLITWTRTYALSLDFSDLFITLGIIEMDMGVRVLGRLDIEEPKMGGRVRATLGTVRRTESGDFTGLIFTKV